MYLTLFVFGLLQLKNKMRVRMKGNVGFVLVCSFSHFKRQNDLIVFLLALSWGLVQPGTLSVPELCHHLAEIWVTGSSCATNIVQFKRHNPGKVRLLPKHWYTSFTLEKSMLLHLRSVIIDHIFLCRK